ncbi:MAG: hypothetical protein K1X79_04925 [Oligoflexia bacterium]|nr:hypothetical protein [Oligoflexia bacterium]
MFGALPSPSPSPNTSAVYDLALRMLQTHGLQVPKEGGENVQLALGVNTHDFGTLMFCLLTADGDVLLEAIPDHGAGAREVESVRISRSEISGSEAQDNEVERKVRAAVQVCDALERVIPVARISDVTGVSMRFISDYLDPLVDFFVAGCERDERAMEFGNELCGRLKELPSYRDWLIGELEYHFEDSPDGTVLKGPLLRMLFDFKEAARTIEDCFGRLRQLGRTVHYESVFTDQVRRLLVSALCAGKGEEDRGHYELILGLQRDDPDLPIS